MIVQAHTSFQMITHVARRLGGLREKLVFVGGAATGLFITESAAPEPRVTQDVDLIVEVISHADYYLLEETLRRIGFSPDMTDGAPICKWLVDGIVVDVMPTDAEILGFSNQWYLPAVRSAISMEIEPGLEILVATAPFFLATKIEAFHGRGGGDFMASHDIEDIVALLDGRREIVEEVRNAPEELRIYLSEQFQGFLKNVAFRESLPGHLPPDAASQARLPLIMRRIAEISGR
uniref:Uncharacterized protein n=1 Tax=Geobacter metallireducens TaxID=28232 RepID=A0A831U276_GEOME